MANFNPPAPLYNPSGAFNPFGLTATLGSDQVIGQSVPDISSFHNGVEHDPLPHLHAPQGVVPLSLSMQSDTATVSSSSSRVASTIPDFTRGFGLDIPEEDEEELEPYGDADAMGGMLSLDEGRVDEVNEPEDDATTAGAHSRHVSRASVALSLKSMGGRSGRMDVENTIEENAPPELENPVEWNVSGGAKLRDTASQRDAQGDLDPAEEWTGSEDNGVRISKLSLRWQPNVIWTCRALKNSPTRQMKRGLCRPESSNVRLVHFNVHTMTRKHLGGYQIFLVPQKEDPTSSHMLHPLLTMILYLIPVKKAKWGRVTGCIRDSISKTWRTFSLWWMDNRDRHDLSLLCRIRALPPPIIPIPLPSSILAIPLPE